MKRLLYILLLWLFLSPAVTAQEPDTLNYRGRPHYTGGDTEKEAFRKVNLWNEYWGSKTDSAKTIFNFEDSIIVNLNYIDFDLEDGWDMQEGRVGWDDDDKTLNVGLGGGSVLQLGQEVHLRCANKTGSLILNGAVVYVDGAQGQRPTIKLANNKTAYVFNTVGLATQDIANNATGYVTLIGLTRDVNTSGGAAGQVAYVDSVDGQWTVVRPGAPLNAVIVGLILYSHSSEGIMGVKVTTVPRLDYLSDVDSRGNQVNWDMLRWSSDSSEWELTGGLLNLPTISTYADNAAAVSGGLVAGDVYRTSTGELMIVYD